MAKSPTAKKQRPTKKNSQNREFDEFQRELHMIDEFTTVVSEYIRHWAKEKAPELARNDRRPLIIPRKDGFQVGRYRMSQKNGTWSVCNLYGDILVSLNYRRSALVYCIYEHLGNFTKSREIALLDGHVTKLETDLVHYAHSLEKALRDKDYARIKIMDARILDTRMRYNQEKDLLKKSLNSAKYLKVWEKQQ